MTIFPVLVFVVYAAISIFVLTLIARFVSAHEHVAESLQSIANSLRDKGNNSKGA